MTEMGGGIYDWLVSGLIVAGMIVAAIVWLRSEWKKR